MNPVLYKAAMEGKSDVLIKYLNEHNEDDLKVQLTPNNNTVLHVAAQFRQTECTREILLLCGESLLFLANIKGETSLHISAREGDIDTVQTLIDHARKLDGDLESETGATKEMLRMTNVEGDTALHEAVRNGHLKVVDILTKEDPDFLHFPNNVKETPLYLAAERSYPDIVFQILENCRISPTYIGPNGRTSFHAATICYDKECIRILYGWKSSLIKEADEYGWRPLHYAASLGHVLAVKQLLDLDKSVAYLVTDYDDNMTTLEIAARQGHIDVMKELLSCCPDCWEMTNNRGQNILHIAAKHKKHIVTKFILANPFASNLINQKDIKGNTPPHLVAASGSFEYSHLHSHPRVDTRAYNNENLTALEIERGQWNPNLVAKLGCRNKFKVKETEKGVEDPGKLLETHLIVAILIATVTFGAAFTIPGLYDGNDGPKQGMTILMRQAAFKAFVVTDTIATVFSITAVFLLMFASYYADSDKRANRHAIAFSLILAAMGAMVIAFMTGFYVVLSQSSGLAITVCIICCFFFLVSYFVFKKWVSDIR